MELHQPENPQNGLAGATVGTVKLAGDPRFDSDSIVNSDPNQWRWLSYPESRLVVNPGDRPRYDGRLSLNIGLFVNGVREMKNLQNIRMAAAGGEVKDWTGLTTAWYPYRLTARALCDAAAVEFSEFFVDKNTFVRLMDVSGAAGQTMILSGEADRLSVLADNSVLVTGDDFYFVYKIMLLNSDSSVRKIIAPTVDGAVWKAEIPFASPNARVAFSLTLAAKADDPTPVAAISRAGAAVGGRLSDKLAATKAYWDEKLSRVPMPTVWGIGGGLDPKGVTREQHRRAFYAAWTFNYQNILEPTPETGYDHYQITLGKASLWPNGNPKAPNNCDWESMFDIQHMAYLEPEIAWDAAAGFIFSIDENGILNGESLPSQKAHMVWACYSNLKDDIRLAAMYPKIKKYLQWRFKNPRWIFGDHDYADEKDISFVTQWYSDVNYAIRICGALGKSDDIAMWQELKIQMGKNARVWFFTPAEGDPADKVYNSFFSDTGVRYAHGRTSDVENYVNSALYADLPEDLAEKMVRHYLAFQKPDEDFVGFDFYKYGDGCHIAYGLYERGKTDPRLAGMWRQFTNAALRSVIRTVEFCEEARPDVFTTAGVTPSSFGASTVIDFTYMNNGMRIDLGTPTAI